MASENEIVTLDSVDESLEYALANSDPGIMMDTYVGLNRRATVTALASIKALWLMHENWSRFQEKGIEGSAEEFALQRSGLAPATYSKYLRMWRGIFANENISDQTKSLLQGRTIQELLLIAPAASEGDLDDEQLKQVALGAKTKHDVQQEIKKARGERTSSKSALTLYFAVQDGEQTPKGTIYTYIKGSRQVVGYLVTDTQIPEVDRLIDRIVSSAGMVEKL